MKKLIYLALLALTFSLNPMALAGWIDAATGEPVYVTPYDTTVDAPANNTEAQTLAHPNQAHVKGHNLVWDKECKTWVDAKTGKEVYVTPYDTTVDAPANNTEAQTLVHPNQAHVKGHNLFWKPCPEEAASSTTGGVKTAPSHAAATDLFQLGVGYSFMRTEKEDVKNLNGFQVSAFVNVTPWLALGAQGSGLFGADSSGGADVTLQRYLYLFGPQVTVQPFSQLPRVSLTGHVLVGGVHDENRVSYGSYTYHSAANAFAMSIGTGVDVRVAPHVTVGPWMDYAPTAFSAPGTSWQNNWSAGFQVRVKF